MARMTHDPSSWDQSVILIISTKVTMKSLRAETKFPDILSAPAVPAPGSWSLPWCLLPYTVNQASKEVNQLTLFVPSLHLGPKTTEDHGSAPRSCASSTARDLVPGLLFHPILVMLQNRLLEGTGKSSALPRPIFG